MKGAKIMFYDEFQKQLEKEIDGILLERLDVLVSEWLSNNPLVLSTEKEWMNKKEAAKYVGVANETFTRFIEDDLRVVRINGVMRISKADIDKYLESKK
ncbi:excisionase family DNA-binding protein [Lysinibacillus sp. GbtcB16]|uniref:excisionase family DNA-binding protein n=1 Tax=Lysinibacillus sp. GbtcB16 TaxID=2824761 RepID=UPI001C309A55|nr:excisionase family DNA-binding protein [Lysinibacillus sp. GbtcB16]